MTEADQVVAESSDKNRALNHGSSYLVTSSALTYLLHSHHFAGGYAKRCIS
jgi:hypothetical protein